MPFYTVLDRFPGVRVALWRLAEDSETLCGFFPEKSKGVCEKAVGGITAEKRRRERLAARLLWGRRETSFTIVMESPEFSMNPPIFLFHTHKGGLL